MEWIAPFRMAAHATIAWTNSQMGAEDFYGEVAVSDVGT